MQLRQAPKSVLITGASKRIGRDIALKLAGAGYRVALHYGHAADEARAVQKEITDAGGVAAALAGDLADPRSSEAIVARAAREIGPLGLLVNSAAIFEGDSITNLDLDLWRRQFAINLETPVFLSAAFAKALPEAMGGAIVNIVDCRVLRLNPRNLSYTLAKSALWTATSTLAQALAPRIRVNAVGPGPTYPNSRDGEAGLMLETAGVLLQQRVSGADIADAVLYLAGARNVTGQMIAVDAGQHLAWRTPDVAE